MNEEKEDLMLPFAVDRKGSAKQCGLYFLLFAAMLAVLVYSMAYESYEPWIMALILAVYLVVALATCLPLVLRCVAKLHLEAEGVRVTALGITVRRCPLEKICFITAMEFPRRGKTAERAQILLSALTMEELALKGGWKKGGHKRVQTGARQYLERYANAGYIRDMNLTRDILWLDWSPERLRLIRERYPDAKWADFNPKHIYDKQMRE